MSNWILMMMCFVICGCEENKQDEKFMSLAELIQKDIWYWPE